jgi:HEAT repeat protein
MADEQTLHNLVTELQHQRPEMRSDAAVKLGKMGGRAATALPALQVALRDPDGLVRRTAQEAIEKITSASEPSSEGSSGDRMSRVVGRDDAR